MLTFYNIIIVYSAIQSVSANALLSYSLLLVYS